MQGQLYTDPSSGRQYYINEQGQSVWADQAPVAPVAPAAPVAPVPSAPMPGQPPFDPSTMGAAAQAAMVQPVTPAGQPADVNLGTFDFNQVEDKLIMVLDPNVSYEFAVKDVKGKKSSSGEDMLEVHLAVTWPERLPSGENCKGASIIDNIVMTPNALWKAKAFLKACEMLGPNGRFSGNSLDDLKGCVVRATVRNEEWNNTTRTKIAGSYTAGFETPGMTPVVAGAAAPAPQAPAPAMPAPVAPAAPMAPMPAPAAPVAPAAPMPANSMAAPPAAPMAPQPPAAPPTPPMPAPPGQ